MTLVDCNEYLLFSPVIHLQKGHDRIVFNLFDQMRVMNDCREIRLFQYCKV